MQFLPMLVMAFDKSGRKLPDLAKLQKEKKKLIT